MNTYLNQLIKIKFSDKKEVESGLLIDFNDEWILLKSNPVDYIIDGYCIIRNKNISKIISDDKTKKIEKAIILKNMSVSENDKIPINDIKTTFEELNKRFGIFQFSKKSDNVIYPGRLKKISEGKLTIEWIDLEANWSKKRIFKLDGIRKIEFNNDYLNSLKLLADNK
ncbi:hypothetical protein [Moheibacter sp.]|uniref:hypothetical protein n=1 Tax=Moheibacter sp. TaxID=1965316 RepID=UPI003C766C39